MYYINKHLTFTIQKRIDLPKLKKPATPKIFEIKSYVAISINYHMQRQ